MIKINAKLNIYARNVLLCILQNMKSVLFELIQLEETIVAERYNCQLSHLTDEIEQKRPFTGQGNGKLILLHDKARRQMFLFVLLANHL